MHSDPEEIRMERSRLRECWRGRPLSYHVGEVRAGLARRNDPDVVIRQRNRMRVRFHIRLMKARGASPMRFPVRF